MNTAAGMFACISALVWDEDLARLMIAQSIKSAHGNKETVTEAQAQEVGGTIDGYSKSDKQIHGAQENAPDSRRS